MHIAIALKAKEKLLPYLKLLEKELAKNLKNLKILLKLEEHIYKMQPNDLGQEFPATVLNSKMY